MPTERERDREKEKLILSIQLSSLMIYDRYRRRKAMTKG